jgi:hypothetical protein
MDGSGSRAIKLPKRAVTLRFRLTSKAASGKFSDRRRALPTNTASRFRFPSGPGYGPGILFPQPGGLFVTDFPRRHFLDDFPEFGIYL